MYQSKYFRNAETNWGYDKCGSLSSYIDICDGLISLPTSVLSIMSSQLLMWYCRLDNIGDIKNKNIPQPITQYH